jgi:SSS family solute:Na+ symporter
MIIGFMTKRVSETAAKIGLLFFIVLYALSQFVFDVQLHYLHVVTVLFVLTVALTLALGKWKPMAVAYTEPDEALVDMRPWRHRHWFFLLLLALMAGAFILFSKSGLAQ